MPGFYEEICPVWRPLCLLGKHSHMKSPLAGSTTGLWGPAAGLNQDSKTSEYKSKLEFLHHVYFFIFLVCLIEVNDHLFFVNICY